ncbi:MAG: penicillin-binding protein 2 [Acidimicrobiia bacterium]|nr:penicillin-binding protein 2 [Acidimicrobiia bacterium]
MNGPIRRLALVLLVGLALVLANVTYIQTIAGTGYRDDARNRRVLLSRAAKERGAIVDRAGEVLAASGENPDEQGFLRVYPFGDLFAHPVGVSSLLFGDRSIERAYTTRLRSKQDLTISDMVAALLGRDLRPESLVLTLDAGLQRVADEAIGIQSGAIVALDPQTGAVLAYVSSPSFDPTTLLGPTAGPAGDTLVANPDEPLLDRISSATFAPGSTFKIVTTAAALELDLARPDTAFDNVTALELPGSTSTISNFDGGACGAGATVTLQTAFVRSCNTVFGQLAMDLGAGAMSQQATAFGFGLDIPFEWDVLDSVFPPPSAFENDVPALAQSGIGQRDVQATPLQMVLVVSAIANQGVIMEPYLVAQVLDANGAVVERTAPTEWQRAITPTTAQILSGLMTQVVSSGTGRSASVPGVQVAGKTGTAETGGAPHAWFVGFAPADNPTIALVVIIQNGGSAGDEATGGSVAAPIASRVFAEWLGRNP